RTPDRVGFVAHRQRSHGATVARRSEARTALHHRAAGCPVVMPGYILGMKTAVSIPDEIFEEAERLAKRMKRSRSQIFSRALAEYVARLTCPNPQAQRLGFDVLGRQAGPARLDRCG